MKPSYTNVVRDRGAALGIVEFDTAEDLDRAIRKLDDTEFKNPFDRTYIRIYEDDAGGKRARSRSRSRSRHAPASRYLPFAEELSLMSLRTMQGKVITITQLQQPQRLKPEQVATCWPLLHSGAVARDSLQFFYAQVAQQEPQCKREPQQESVCQR